MSYTKLELVKGALTEIGLGSYMIDLSSDQLGESLSRLDAMLAEWNGRGIRLRYPIESSPGAVASDDDAGIPDWSYEAVITNLAIRLAPSYGIVTKRETNATATRGMNTLYARSAMPSNMRLGPIPSGAGSKTSEPFLPREEDEVVHKAEESVKLE
jgi:hypothetical protein